MAFNAIARTLVAGCLLIPMGGIGQVNLAPYSADVSTIDSNEQTQSVANILVYVRPVGHYTTGNEGEFTFPSPGPGVSDVTFQIDDWIIALPCLLGSGHTHLSAKRNAIEIVAYQRGDQRLAEEGKLKRFVECAIETAAADFNSGSSSARLLQPGNEQETAIGSGGGFLRRVAYFRGSGNIGIKETMESSLSAAEQDSPPQNSIDRSQFVQDQAQEYGVAPEELTSAINAWIGDAQSGKSAFDQGLANVYLGHFEAALSSFAKEKEQPGADTYKKDVLSARAQYGIGEREAAEVTLKKVLATHPGDTVVTAALNVVQGPSAPTGIRATTVQPHPQ